MGPGFVNREKELRNADRTGIQGDKNGREGKEREIPYHHHYSPIDLSLPVAFVLSTSIDRQYDQRTIERSSDNNQDIRSSLSRPTDLPILVL